MKNKYEIRGDITAIFVESPKYGNHEILIDTDELDKFKQFNSWCVHYEASSNNYYARTNQYHQGSRKTLRMHRLLFNDCQGMDIDHINHNTLDNRKCNLRCVTRSENMQNLPKTIKSNSSGIRGVSWHKQSKKWQVRVILNNKVNYLGKFDNIMDAKETVTKFRNKHMPYSEMDRKP